MNIVSFVVRLYTLIIYKVSTVNVLYAITLSVGKGGRVGSVVVRRAIDLKVRGSSPAHGGSRIAG